MATTGSYLGKVIAVLAIRAGEEEGPLPAAFPEGRIGLQLATTRTASWAAPQAHAA